MSTTTKAARPSAQRNDLAQATLGDPIHSTTLTLDLTGFRWIGDGEDRISITVPIEPNPLLGAQALALAAGSLPNESPVEHDRLADGILDLVYRAQIERVILSRLS